MTIWSKGRKIRTTFLKAYARVEYTLYEVREICYCVVTFKLRITYYTRVKTVDYSFFININFNVHKCY